MSASIMPFIARQPSRRIAGGWLLISCGRRMTRGRLSAIWSMNPRRPSSLSENAVADATLNVPERNICSMPSWITSVYALSGRNGPSSSPASTAFAILPTPDCSGSNVAGSLPRFTCPDRKLHLPSGDQPRDGVGRLERRVPVGAVGRHDGHDLLRRAAEIRHADPVGGPHDLDRFAVRGQRCAVIDVVHALQFERLTGGHRED